MKEAKEANRHALLLMEKIGGGFASHLAKAWLRADGENNYKLMSVFEDLHDYYVNKLTQGASNEKD